MTRKSVDNSELERWRLVDAATAIAALSDYAKLDPDYEPRKDQRSTRWHVTAGGRDYEVVCTGPRFLDTRSNQGGGGAVDLAMHLLCVDFKSAVKALRERAL